MDVEMERQGIPTAFGTSQAADTAPHEATNMVAPASNAETLPMKPVAGLESSEPLVAFTSAGTVPSTQDSSEVQINENGVVSVPANENHLPASGTSGQPHLGQENFTTTQPNQQHDSSLPTKTSLATEAVTPTSASAPEYPAAPPSSQVVEAAEEVTMPSLEQVTKFHTEPTPLPEQPISDLRTSPQTDMSNVAQPTSLATTTENTSTQPQSEPSSLPLPATQSTETMSQTPPAVLGNPAQPPFEVSNTADAKLPSPPAVSPPPALRPTEPILSEDQAMVDAPVATPQIEEAQQPTPATLPIEEPRDPAPTPATLAVAQAPQDHVMTDASESLPVKVARSREDDNGESEPAAKRAKTETDEEQNTFKIPEVPATTQTPPATNGATSTGEDDTVTLPRLAHMKKIISNLKKGKSSLHFRIPVDYVGLGIPTYPEVIKEPMDLGTIDTKLKAKQYSGVSEFVRDFNLIVNNCYTFNGPEHAVSQLAQSMEASFNNQMKLMPPAGVVEPSKEEKKQQKVKAEPVRQAPPRRQSMNAGTARSPSASNNPQTFALGPEGVPLIRRDSNVNDGRAKRAVVPPKRHSDFAGRPKKKKYELELKFCWEVLKELQSTKHWSFAQYFYSPVDPVALNIPTYFQIIKKPMDLGTIQSKLENNAYEKASEFKEDVQLIFKNCYKFNPDGEFVNDCGHKLEDVFEEKWKGKEEWLAARQPDSEPHSAAEEDEEEDDEESDGEAEDDSEDDRNNKIKQLQKQIEMMSKQMGELTQPKKKKKSTPPMPPKKTKTKSDKKEKSAGSKGKKEEQQPKKKMKKVTQEKERFVTYNEKQYISNGISQLPDKQMGEALKLIQNNVPSLKGVEETEIELDIDELPNRVLLKLLQFVEKCGGGPLPPAAVSEPTYAVPAASGAKPKKNKPMGKAEQEAHIEELNAKLGAYNGGGTMSPNAHPSIEQDTSGDEGSDSEESEEE